MAQAMTPEEAVHAISSLRRQREHLTLRAAGIIWMVWALVLGLLGFASQASYHATYAAGWVDPMFILVGGSIGALVTNAVWRAHALEQDPGHRSWAPWLLGVGGLMALGLLVLLSNQFDVGLPGSPLMLAPLALVGSYAAAAATVAMRRHVPIWPGAVASGILLAAFLSARLLSWPDAPFVDFAGNAALNLLNITVLTLVGLLHYRRG